MPQKFNKRLQYFLENNVVFPQDHVNLFIEDIDTNAAKDYQDVVLKLFLQNTWKEMLDFGSNISQTLVTMFGKFQPWNSKFIELQPNLNFKLNFKVELQVELEVEIQDEFKLQSEFIHFFLKVKKN